MTEADVRKLLRSRIKESGSQRAFAREYRVPVARVNEFLHKKRVPNAKILKALGLRVAYALSQSAEAEGETKP